METQQYVFLNNKRLPISGMVQWRRITPFPDQLMIGTPTVSDYTPTSKQAWANIKGGMGIEKWTAETNDRYWDADGVDASINMQSLAPLVTTIGSFGASPVKIIKFNGYIWAIGHNKIAYWDGATWQVKKSDFANPTDCLLFYGNI